AFRLAGLRDGSIRIDSDRLGTRTLEAAAVARGDATIIAAAALESTPIAPLARTNRAMHINQVYDTRDEFDGRGSCGPTSSVMNLADYQLAGWGLWVNSGG